MRSTARPKLRLESDHWRIVKFLQEQNYPSEWAEDVLRETCICVRVEQDGKTIAYIWGQWSPLPNTLDFHACSSKRLWLTPEILNRLYIIAELFGADALEATPVGDGAPVIRRLLHRVGFEDVGDTLMKRLET